MSNLFKQISQEAARQKEQVQHSNGLSPSLATDAAAPQPLASIAEPPRVSAKMPARPPKQVSTQSGTTAPSRGTTGPHLDIHKLGIIVRELSQLPTNSNGLNVRLSLQEAQDIEDFIHATLRKRGLKGNHVSAAKLVRYAFRYLLRVHEAEFIRALEQGLKVEETLSI
jgi:hypothetical protein